MSASANPGRMLPRRRSAGAHADVLELPIPRADFCSPRKHASEPVRPSPGARRAVSHGHASPSAARDDPFRRLAATRRVIALATFRSPRLGHHAPPPTSVDCPAKPTCLLLVPAVGRTSPKRPTRTLTLGRCPHLSEGGWWIESTSVGGLSPWLVISARKRACRSLRSLIVSGVRRRRSRRTFTIPPRTRPRLSRLGIGGCVGAAVLIRNRATARATLTSTARLVTRVQSRGSGPRTGWLMRCAPGGRPTDACRRRATGHGRMPAGVGETRSRAWHRGSGPRRAWSRACSVRGPLPARPPWGNLGRGRRVVSSAVSLWAVTRSPCLNPANRPQNPRI